MEETEAHRIIKLIRETLQDDAIMVYADNPACFTAARPVLDEAYALVLTLEKGSFKIQGLPTVLSVKIGLRSVQEKEENMPLPWIWPLGKISTKTIKMEASPRQKRMSPVTAKLSSYLCKTLKTIDLEFMIEDCYLPVKGPIDMSTALKLAADKYETILTSLVQAVIMGLHLPEKEQI